MKSVKEMKSQIIDTKQDAVDKLAFHVRVKGPSGKTSTVTVLTFGDFDTKEQAIAAFS